jgi:hypothetical protein
MLTITTNVVTPFIKNKCFVLLQFRASLFQPFTMNCPQSMCNMARLTQTMDTSNTLWKAVHTKENSKKTAFWDIVPHSLEEVDRCFTCTYCFHYQEFCLPDDGRSKDLWNVGLLLRDRTALYPGRLLFLYSSLWEPEKHNFVEININYVSEMFETMLTESCTK